MSRLIAVLMLVAPSLALAQPIEGMETMTTTAGTCPVFRDGGEVHGPACKTIVYAHFSNGRTAWSIPTSNGALTLSGGRDEQSEAGLHILTIDTVRRASGGGPSRSSRAAGTCQAVLSKDGVFLRSVTCMGTSERGPFSLTFVGGGQPTKIEHF